MPRFLSGVAACRRDTSVASTFVEARTDGSGDVVPKPALFDVEQRAARQAPQQYTRNARVVSSCIRYMRVNALASKSDKYRRAKRCA